MSLKILVILITGAALIGLASSILFPAPYGMIISMIGGGIYGHLIARYRSHLE